MNGGFCAQLENQLKHRFCGLLVCSMLAGCKAGPDFVRPSGTAPAAYTQEALPALDGSLQPAGDAETAWWGALHSPALDALIQQAFAGNRSLEAQTARIAQALAQADASRGPLFPHADGSISSGRQKYGAAFLGPNAFPAFTYFAIGPSVSYTLDYAGGARRAVEQQQALADYQAFQRQAAALALSGNIAHQALTIASTRAQITTVHAILDDDRRNAQLVQTAFDAGAGTRVDLYAAQSQLANDQTLLPGLEQQLGAARHALSILVGRAPGEWTPPDFDFSMLSLPSRLALSQPSELAHRRPDILASEAQAHAATAALGVATANLYPQLRLTASAGQQSTVFDQLLDSGSAAWGLGTALTEPLFDGGTLRAQKHAAQEALHASLASYQQTVLDAFGQVADVLTALQHDSEQETAQQNALESARANLDLSRRSYAAGNSGVLQVLDAQRLQQQAQLGAVRAQAQRYQDTVQLFLALGGNTPGSTETASR